MVTTKSTEKNWLSLGDMVVCDAYARPTRSYFNIYKDEDGEHAVLVKRGENSAKEVDGYESCEKFETVEALFTGVFVGTTILNTELICEWEDAPYVNSGFYCTSVNPKPFAVVYYALNRKRLVPMDHVRMVSK